MRRRAVVVVALMVSMAACASPEKRYDSALELRSAAVNAGLNCTRYNPMTPPSGAASAGHCVGSGSHAEFVVYNGDDAASKGADEAQRRLGSGDAMLVGPNWYLSAAASEVSDLHDAVGGEVRS